jgi:hypothetical protein
MASTIWFDRLSRNGMQRHHRLVTDRIVESTGRWLAKADCFAVAASGRSTEWVSAATGGGSFGALVAQLRRTEGDGFDP